LNLAALDNPVNPTYPGVGVLISSLTEGEVLLIPTLVPLSYIILLPTVVVLVNLAT
jgi:hypothetical protein